MINWKEFNEDLEQVSHLQKMGSNFLSAERKNGKLEVVYGDDLPSLIKQGRLNAEFFDLLEKQSYIGKDPSPSGGNPIYRYSPEDIEKREEKKAKKYELLSELIDAIRDQYKLDMQNEKGENFQTALAVALIDATYERVGNPLSPEERNTYGVTTFRKKHFDFPNSKEMIIKYKGKKGVKQVKVVTDTNIIDKIKYLLKDKQDEDEVFPDINNNDVNRYLNAFGITAKDIRGFHANHLMEEALAEGKEFKEALEEVADLLGHEPNTLKNSYLRPSLVEEYDIKKKIKKKASFLFEKSVPESITCKIFEDNKWNQFVIDWYPKLIKIIIDELGDFTHKINPEIQLLEQDKIDKTEQNAEYSPFDGVIKLRNDKLNSAYILIHYLHELMHANTVGLLNDKGYFVEEGFSDYIGELLCNKPYWGELNDAVSQAMKDSNVERGKRVERIPSPINIGRWLGQNYARENIGESILEKIRQTKQTKEDSWLCDLRDNQGRAVPEKYKLLFENWSKCQKVAQMNVSTDSRSESQIVENIKKLFNTKGKEVVLVDNLSREELLGIENNIQVQVPQLSGTVLDYFDKIVFGHGTTTEEGKWIYGEKPSTPSTMAGQPVQQFGTAGRKVLYVVCDESKVGFTDAIERYLRGMQKVALELLPKEINSIIEELNPTDVGKEDIGIYRIRYEGFCDECWEEVKGKNIKQIEQEILDEWFDSNYRLIESNWQRGGVVGEPDIFYAVYQFNKISKLDGQTSNFKELEKAFEERTKKHIKLVQEAAQKIVDKYPEYKELLERVKNHDSSKFEEPEKTPYVYINYQYKCKDLGEKFECPEGMKDKMNAATLRHVRNNPHYPESSLKDKNQANINREDRDKSEQAINASNMDELDVLEMVSDWVAMSKEKSTSLWDWYSKVNGKRWIFSEKQQELIKKLINIFEKELEKQADGKDEISYDLLIFPDQLKNYILKNSYIIKLFKDFEFDINNIKNLNIIYAPYKVGEKVKFEYLPDSNVLKVPQAKMPTIEFDLHLVHELTHFIVSQILPDLIKEYPPTDDIFNNPNEMMSLVQEARMLESMGFDDKTIIKVLKTYRDKNGKFPPLSYLRGLVEQSKYASKLTHDLAMNYLKTGKQAGVSSIPAEKTPTNKEWLKVEEWRIPITFKKEMVTEEIKPEMWDVSLSKAEAWPTKEVSGTKIHYVYYQVEGSVPNYVLKQIAEDEEVIESGDITKIPTIGLTKTISKLDKQAESTKEIQKIVNEPSWQKLRESLSWKKDNIGSSLRKLHKYLGSSSKRSKKLRVLNLLNAVARGGISTEPIKNWQKRLKRELGVGEYKKAAQSFKLYKVELPNGLKLVVCDSCLKGEHLSYGMSHLSNIEYRRDCKNSIGVFQCQCSQDQEDLWLFIKDNGREILKQEPIAKSANVYEPWQEEAQYLQHYKESPERNIPLNERSFPNDSNSISTRFMKPVEQEPLSQPYSPSNVYGIPKRLWTSWLGLKEKLQSLKLKDLIK